MNQDPPPPIALFRLAGDRQRSADEFRTLYADAGFALSRIVPTPARVSVIEGIPQ